MILQRKPVRVLRVPRRWLRAEPSVDCVGGLDGMLGQLCEGADREAYCRAWADVLREPEAEVRAREERAWVAPDDGAPLPCVLQGDGMFMLLDGHHRAARRMADFPAVEVAVVHVSPEWERLESDLRAIYGREALYHAVPHPWFSGWDVLRDKRRLDLVAMVVRGAVPGHHLDVGCLTGWLCRAVASSGRWSVGVDLDARAVSLAERLQRVVGRASDRTTYLRLDPAEVLSLAAGWRWAAVTCLSVWHRRYAAGERDEAAVALGTLARATPLLVVDGPSERDGPHPEGFAVWLAGVVSPLVPHEWGPCWEGRPVFVCR